MGVGGMTLVEQGHFVSLFTPESKSAAGSSEIFSLENWGHATIIVQGGAGSASTIVVEECDNFTPSNVTTFAYNYAKEATAGGDVLDAALAAAGTAGISIGTATDTILVIEIDGDELTDGYPCIRIRHSDPGTSKLISAIAVLTGGRYQKDITATAEA